MRRFRPVPSVPIDASARRGEYDSMLQRVLERHAPSRLLALPLAGVLTFFGGLELGATFLLGVVSREAGWCDHYPEQ